ncbi:MAG: succinylglutamate desuccinylase/aspartoacylase family protein [Chloroflexi bacterium]|nr:succinylglutamate desuccinylase/aspartoacylase family protein [Chloroflexota bacterium]
MSQQPTLFDSLVWKTHPIGAGAAHSTLNLSIGDIAGAGGPRALITAGIHGDEGPWGAWAIRQLLQTTPLDALQGSLRIVPNANPLAMEADARNAPLDSLDLNRSFPGDAQGSHTERLAAALVAHALPDANVVIDLHGGGSWCVNAFVFEMPGGEALAAAFDAPFVAKAPERAVTLTGYARSQGAMCVGVEMGGRSADEESWARRIAAGLRRALIAGGVLSGESEPPAARSIPVGGTRVLRPSSGGVFVPRIRQEAIGTIVPQGTVLGEVVHPSTQQLLETFVAPFPQTAILLLRPMMARLEGGAMTYVVAEPQDA